MSNVLTTGPMTIPAMKRSGFSARVAGAVEATASSGETVPSVSTVRLSLSKSSSWPTRALSTL